MPTTHKAPAHSQHQTVNRKLMVSMVASSTRQPTVNRRFLPCMSFCFEMEGDFGRFKVYRSLIVAISLCKPKTSLQGLAPHHLAPRHGTPEGLLFVQSVGAKVREVSVF